MTHESEPDPRAPAWLHPLLSGQIVTGQQPFARVRQAAWRDPALPAGVIEVAAPSDRVHFATVDRLDTNRVLDFYAIAPPDHPRGDPTWWARRAEGWQRLEGDPASSATDVLRWVAPVTVPSVEAQLHAYYARTGPARGVDTDKLRLRLLRALRQQGVGSLDTAWGYVQWAGYPDGLLIEVGDGKEARHTLAQELWGQIRWHGWNAPDAEHRNAWFEAREPGAVDAAYDLVDRTLRTLAGLGQSTPDPIPQADAGPCARCLALGPDGSEGHLVPVPESEGMAANPPYTHVCRVCGTPNWRTPREPHLVSDLDDLLAYFGSKDLRGLADSLEAEYDVRLDTHETATVGPTFECGGHGTTVPYPADVAVFLNLVEAYEQSLAWTGDHDIGHSDEQ